MVRRTYPYLLAGADFIFFNLVAWSLAFAFPSIFRLYGGGIISYIFPLFLSILMVFLLAIFRQYRFSPRDRFLRQFLGAFNVVTLGFLVVVVISLDLGAMVSVERGLLFLLLLGLILATAMSRVITYFGMGGCPDFSLKEPVVFRNGNGNGGRNSKPLILSDHLTISEVKQKIESSPHDFAVLTDSGGYYSGIINDGNIIEYRLKNPADDVAVAEIMNRRYPVAREILSPYQMRQTMIDRNLRFLPLLANDGKPSRVVLLSDLDAKYHRQPTKKNARSVLVIGGAGYIGSIMVRYLLKRGYQVSVLDNLLYGYDALKDLDNHPGYRFYKGDARNIQDLLTAMQDVDAIIHLAAIVGDPACELDHRATIDINYESSKILVNACLHKRVNRLLFASSCSVYGASENGELLTEASSLNPVSLYAETRLRSEEAILAQAESPLIVTMLRLATVFGFSYRPRFDLVVNILTARALEDKEISIFGGSQWRPNVHVLDVVRAFVAVLEAPTEAVDRQVFNVGSEKENYRIAQLGEMVREAIPETHVKSVEAEIDRRDYRVSFNKIESTLDWQAKFSVPDGIKEIIEAHRLKKFRHYSEKIYSNYKHLQ